MARPPSRKNKQTVNNFLTDFSEFLDLINGVKNVFIMGDFNFHFDQSSDPNAFALKTLIGEHGSEQLVQGPTHKHWHTLDLVLTRNEIDLGDFNVTSILAYNGAAIMAMKGKNCVAIASDRRFGVQGQTVSMDFDKIFEMGPHLYIGLPGLATDVQTVSQRLKFRLNMYELRENRRIKPKTFMSMVSNLLYERRFGPYFVEPVIAGLDSKTFEPYIASMDLIGCPMETSDFVVSGTCAEQMYGMCESLWEPDLGPEDLFETISQALMNAFDRDAVSGWGAVVYIIEKDKVTKKFLKTRQD